MRDFTRKPARRVLTRVMVSPYVLDNGQPSKRLVTWASFTIESEAYDYAAKLRAANPAWVVEVRSQYRRKAAA